MLIDNPFTSDARVEREITSLLLAGYSITIAAIKTEDLVTEDTFKDAKIHRVLSPILLRPLNRYYGVEEKKAINILVNFDYDCIHCHDYHLLSLANKLVKRKKSIKFVYDSHEFFSGWPVYLDSIGWTNKIKSFIVWKFLLFKEEKICKNADGVLCTTKYIKEHLKKKFGNKPEFEYIRNVPSLNFSEKSFFLHKYLSLDSSTKIIIHSGNIYLTFSEFEILINCIKSIKNCVVVFLSNRRDINKYSCLVNECLNNKTVFFLDYVSGEKLGEVLGSADIGLSFVKTGWISHYLASPNRLMEYLKVGIPFISNLNIEAKELSKRNIGYCINSINFEELKETINSILDNYNDIANHCEKSKTYFTWEYEEKKLIKFYSNILRDERTLN